MEKWNSRKFWAMIGYTILFTVLLDKALIAETVYQALMTILLLAYFGANIADKFGNK